MKIRSTILSIACVVLTLGSPTPIGATETPSIEAIEALMPSSSEESARLDKEIEQYLYVDQEGAIKFDIASAETSGASQQAVRAGEYINGYTSSVETRSLDGFMNKWRYCGPNNSQPGPPQVGKPADEACRNHDECLRNAPNNEAKKSCDQNLINATQYELDHNRGAYSWDEIAYLHAMKHAIGWAKNNCRVDNPPSICHGKLR